MNTLQHIEQRLVLIAKKTIFILIAEDEEQIINTIAAIPAMQAREKAQAIT